MRDRTRRFTVGFSDGSRHVRILASDERTRTWADRHGPLMNVVLWKFEQSVEGRKFASDPTLPMALADVETPRSLAARFAELLRRGFPGERFEIRAELQS